jgi:hypothetical protein
LQAEEGAVASMTVAPPELVNPEERRFLLDFYFV